MVYSINRFFFPQEKKIQWHYYNYNQLPIIIINSLSSCANLPFLKIFNFMMKQHPKSKKVRIFFVQILPYAQKIIIKILQQFLKVKTLRVIGLHKPMS